MGRKTFESIGKPLSNRLNIILTKDKDFKADGCLVFNDIFEVLLEVMKESQVFIIGGGEIYKQSLELADKIYLTLVHQEFEGDTQFPELNSEWAKMSRNDFDVSIKIDGIYYTNLGFDYPLRDTAALRKIYREVKNEELKLVY
jgi:dihydrofolate reductase